jgi:hypothetical protein
MKRLQALLILILLSKFTFSQIDYPSISYGIPRLSSKELGYIGKIKLIIHKKYIIEEKVKKLQKIDSVSFSADGNILQEIRYFPKGMRIQGLENIKLSKTIYKYNANGTLSGIQVSRQNEIYSQRKFIYDAKGGLKKIESYNDKDSLDQTEIVECSDTNIRTRTLGKKFYKSMATYKYDKNKRLVEFQSYSSTFSNNPFTTNNEALPMEFSNADSLQVLTWSYQYKYNDKGCCVEEINYEYDEKKEIRYKVNYTCDNVCNHLESIMTDKNGKQMKKEIKKFDAYGNELEIIVIEDGQTIKVPYSYSYDRSGNWIKYKPLDDEVEERIIYYY